MQIKKILKYEWNYAEYLVTDGKNDLVCMCDSVPLPLDCEPKIGMQVAQLYGFSYKDMHIIKVINNLEQEFSIVKGKGYFEYDLQGKIIDKNKSLLSVEGFSISLEKDFDCGLPDGFENGDIVKLSVDRLDCTLE